MFNPPKSARLFNPPPEDQQQQQEEEEDASTAIASTTTGTSNIFFAARSSATTNLVELAEQSASGYLLAWGPSMTTFTVICQNEECDDTCPELCEVARTAILRGLIWWDGVTGPDDSNFKKAEYEVKNDKDTVEKTGMIFEGYQVTNPAGSPIWSFEVDLSADTDDIPQDDWQRWEITAKQKIEGVDKDIGKLQTDKFELTIIDLPPPPQTPEPSDRPSSSPSGLPSSRSSTRRLQQ